mgnify:CR=1 FL=1
MYLCIGFIISIKDILAVARPSSTVVTQRGNRFVVIKRTSKRVGKRVVPIDLGMVGEIIDGKFVAQVSPKRTKKSIDIKLLIVVWSSIFPGYGFTAIGSLLLGSNA